MDIYIYNTSFKLTRIIDNYISFIWNEKYASCGDFELYMQLSEEILADVKQSYYVRIIDSEMVMIVEEIDITNDIEKGITVKFSGRSLESILERRIIWSPTTISGNLQNGIKKIITENFISAASDRKISNFVFSASTNSFITSLSIEPKQYTGDNIYKLLTEICDVTGIGFKVILNSSNQFIFSLYYGKDRSYSQNANPYVIFSQNFENLMDVNFFASDKTYKNVTLVAGEDKDKNRKTRVIGSTTGLNRRELYTDARDIQSEKEDGTALTTAEYNARLDQRGREKLIEYPRVQTFEGEIDSIRSFIYGKDFFMGDIVQIDDEFGMRFRVRIDGIVRTVDDEGYKVYPTFYVVD